MPSERRSRMTAVEPASQATFEAPGPGSWSRDAVHFPRQMTRYWVQTHPAAFMRGFRDMTRFYGLLIDTMEMRYVNGFAYSAMRPVAEEEVAERFRRADEVLETKLWREQLRDWDETIKPASIERHRALQSLDPDA